METKMLEKTGGIKVALQRVPKIVQNAAVHISRKRGAATQPAPMCEGIVGSKAGGSKPELKPELARILEDRGAFISAAYTTTEAKFRSELWGAVQWPGFASASAQNKVYEAILCLNDGKIAAPKFVAAATQNSMGRRGPETSQISIKKTVIDCCETIIASKEVLLKVLPLLQAKECELLLEALAYVVGTTASPIAVAKFCEVLSEYLSESTPLLERLEMNMWGRITEIGHAAIVAAHEDNCGSEKVVLELSFGLLGDIKKIKKEEVV